MKLVARIISSFAVLGVGLALACSAEDAPGGEQRAALGEGDELEPCELAGHDDGTTVGAACVARTWDGCAEGVWGDESVFTCGDDVALGCCFPFPGPDVSCPDVGGECQPYSAEGCAGSWLPKNTNACTGEGMGCCVP